MAINTKIPIEQWSDFFSQLSNQNQGRNLSLEIYDQDSGDVGATRQGQLLAVDYDPVGKGNDIVVTTGVDQIDYSHTIPSPVEVWQAENDNGRINAIEIIDQNNVKTIVSLEY